MDFAGAMPLAGTLGVTIQEGTRERVTGRLPVRPDICTAGNIVHGGAIMALADCLGAVGAFLTLPDGASGTTTIERQDQFPRRRPGRVGARRRSDAGQDRQAPVGLADAYPHRSGRRGRARHPDADGALAGLTADAIVCAVRAHGEHGAILRALTERAGLVAGYVRGGRSRRLRPILMPGNLVALDLRARTEDQLGGATVEMIASSRAPLLAEPLAAAAIDWATSLTAAALPESQPYPSLYAALSALLEAIAAAPAARLWAAALARYELLLLAELGFGLSLDECVATGTADDLAFVSPKSGRGGRPRCRGWI